MANKNQQSADFLKKYKANQGSGNTNKSSNPAKTTNKPASTKPATGATANQKTSNMLQGNIDAWRKNAVSGKKTTGNTKQEQLLGEVVDYLKSGEYDPNKNAEYTRAVAKIGTTYKGMYDAGSLNKLSKALTQKDKSVQDIGGSEVYKAYQDLDSYGSYVQELQKQANEAKKNRSQAWWQNVGNILANAGNALSGNTFMPADTNIAAGAKAKAEEAQKAYETAQSAYNQAKSLDLQSKYGGYSYSYLKREAEKYPEGSFERQWIEDTAQSKKTAGNYKTEIRDIDAQIAELKRTNYYGVVGQEFNSQTGETYDRTGWVNDDKIKQLENQKQDLEGWENALIKKQEYANKTKLSDFKSLSEVPEDAYLGAFSGDMLYSYINGDNFGSQEARSIGKFTNKQLNKLTDEEKQIYNYIHNTDGKEAANEYLEYLKYDLNARVASETQEENVRFANEHPVLASAASVPTSLASGAGIIDAAYQNIRRDITGEPTRIDYNTGAQQLVKTTTDIRGTVAKNITDATGVIDIDPKEHPIFAQILNGKSLGDVYQLGMSTVDSMAAAAIGNITGIGATSSILLGGSAGSQGVLEALDKGATDEQALLMGLYNGAFETLFEYVSLDKLLHSSGNVVADMLTQMFTEGSEEVNTSIANAIAEGVILNENSDFRKEIRRLMDEELKGITNPSEEQIAEAEKKATQQAWKDLGTGLLWDFIGGAAMGGVSSVAWNSLGNTSKALTDNREYKGNASEIVNTGDALRAMQESAGLNDSAETADTLSNTVDALRSKIEAGEKVTNKDVRTAQEQIDKATRQVVENAIKESLSGTGNEQRASQIADAIFEGKGISAKKGTAWIGQNEGLNKAYRAGMNSYADMLELAEKAADIAKKNEEAVKSDNAENVYDAERRAKALRLGADTLRTTKSLDRNAPIASNGDRLSNVTGIKVDGDTVSATLSTGETVNLDDLDIVERPNTSNEASFGYQIKRLVKSYGEASQAVYQGFLNSGMTLSAYLDVADRITTIAKSSSLGYAEGIKALRNSKLVQGLSNLQQEHLWSIGKGLVVKQRAHTKNADYKNTNVSTEDIEIGGETFKGASDMEAGYKDLATRIAKASKGNLSFHFFHGGEGNTTNGFYLSGVVYINVDAVRDGKSLVSYTMSHELTHFIQEYNADAYKKLKDFVVKKLTKKKGKTLNALVLAKQARDTGISYEDALDEVVADGCEMMLQNSNILEELAVQDQSLAQTVISHAKAFIKRVTSGLNPIHDEAKELMKYADQLQKMWDKALAEAITSEEGRRFVKSEETKTQYSWNEKAFADEVQNWYDTHTEEERAADGGFFTIGRTSDVLKKIGVRDGKVTLGHSKVNKILNDHAKEGIGLDVIKKAPGIIEDPVIILKSKTREGSLVAFSELTTSKGKKVMVALNLTPLGNNTLAADYTVITGAYTRRLNNIRNLVTSSEILYISPENKNIRAITWLDSLRVQFPSDQPVFGSIGKISYSGDKVKITGKKLSEIAKYEIVEEDKGKEQKSVSDAEYLNAVKEGDLKKAENMVAQAARKKGYTTKVYHGSTNFGDHTVLRTTNVESATDGGTYAWSPYFATDDPRIAQSYAAGALYPTPIYKANNPRLDNAFDSWDDEIQDSDILTEESRKALRNIIADYRKQIETVVIPAIKDVAIREADNDPWNRTKLYHMDEYSELMDYDSAFTELAQKYNITGEDLDKYVELISTGNEALYNIMDFMLAGDALYDNNGHEINGGTYEFYANTKDFYEMDAKGARWDKLFYEGESVPTNTRGIAERALKAGYKGVIIRNVYDNGGRGSGTVPRGTVYIFFDPAKQVKSADPVTYDDRGEVIPLSERFNEENNDIRFSKADVTETKQFKKWFGNSKVVDEDGKPLVVYHGSPATDITAFDLGMAGKNTGVYSDKAIWFTDDYSFADGMAYEQLPGSSMFTVKRGKKGKVYGTYLSIQNPFNFRNMTSEMRNDLYKMYQKRLKDQGFSPKSRAEFDEDIDIALEAGNDQFAKFYLDYDMLRQMGYDGIIARLYSYPQNRGDALEYGVLKNTQIKSATENVGTYDGGNTNIYYSKQDIGEADTVVYDEDGEVAVYTDEDENIQFSRASWDEIGRDKLYDFLDKQIEAGELSKSEAKKIKKEMETLYGILKEFEDSDEFTTYSQWSKATIKTDDNGVPILSVITPNGEYKMNIDYSLVCKKRRTLDAVYNKLVELGAADDVFANTKDASSKQIVTINNLIRREGFETACALCFVDAKRFRVINVADQFVNIWNRTVNSLSKDPIAYHNFGGDKTLPDIKNGIDTYDDSQLDFSYIEKVLAKEANRESHTVPYKVAQYIKENPSERKLLSRGDFISSNGFGTVQLASPGILKLYNQKKGSGGPKASFFDKVYANDIIDSSAFKAKAAYEVGGVRLQSFSDYVAHLVFDYLQAFSELSAKKLPAHAYTKEALFALQFGKTGMKINMSLVPNVKANGVAAGLDADGNYAWAGESFANEWVRDNEKFLTELGYGDIYYDENGKRRKMSNLGFELAKKIQRAKGYTDNVGTIAVGVSDEHIRKMLRDPDIRMVIPYHKSGLNPVVAKMNNISAFTDYTNLQNTREYKDGKWTKVKTEPFSWNKWLHENPDKTAKDAAEEYKRICKEKGLKPRFDQFAGEDGYYKLLEDFTEYNEQGEYVAQGAVQMNFPTADDAFGDMKSLVKLGLTEDESLNKRQNEKVEKIAKEIMSVSETKEWIKGEYDFGEKARYSRADDSVLDENGEDTTDSKIRFSVRDTEAPRKTMIGYKVFMVDERFPGQLYPTKIANPGGKGTPIGVWLDADTGELVRNPDGSIKTNTKGRIAVVADSSKQAAKQAEKGQKGEITSKTETLAWRPGWHLGQMPEANQMNVVDKMNPESNDDNKATKGVIHKNYVFCEVEFAADKDYQLEAFEYGSSEKGTYTHSQAGLPFIPEDGYYKYRTNPDPSTSPWFISGSIKITKILDDEMRREILKKNGFQVTEREGHQDIDLSKYGLKAGDVTKSGLVTPAEDLKDLPKRVDYSEEIRNLPGYKRNPINWESDSIKTAFKIQQIEDRYDELKAKYESDPYHKKAVENYTNRVLFSRADVTDDELTEALADEDYERAERVANNDAALSRKALKHDLLNRFSIPEGLRDSLGKKIDSFADDILRDGVVNEKTKEDLYNDLYDAGIIKMPAEETATLAAEQMKGSRLYVPEAVKAEFSGDYNRIRTKLMGYKVYLTSDAKDIGVDTLNAEMAEQFPHLFDATSSDEKEILENILDIFENQTKDKEYTLDDYAEMMRKTEGLDIESQQESLERGFDYAVQAFSEKAELEFTLRNRLAGKLTREGEAKLQQRIKDLKSQRKDLKQAEEDLEKKVRAVQRERDRAQEQVLFYRNQLSINKNFKKAKPEDVNRFTRNLLESDLWWPVRTQARDIYADMNAIASNLMNGKTDIYEAAYNIAAKCINSAIDVYGKDGRQDDYISALTSEIISGLFDADVRQEYTYAERMQNRLERAKADNKELKAKYQALKKQQAERRKASKYKQQILKLYDTANKMLTSPKKSITGHAAMDLMRAVAEMCQYIGTAQDKFYTNKYEALDKLIDEQGSTETRVNRERHLKKTIQQLSELQFRYNQVKNDPMYNYEYDESVNEMLNTLKDTLSGNTLDDLESDKLREIYDAMSALMKTVTEANKLTALNTEKTVLEFAKEAGADIDKAQAIKNETLRDYMNKQKSPDVMFNYFGGYKKGSSFNKMQQMFVDSMRRYLEVKKQFQEIFDESITNNKEFKQMMYEPTKHLVDWGLKDQDGNAVATSRGMMLAAYKLLLQEDSFNAIAKAGFQIPKIEAFYKDDMARAFGGGDDAKFYSQNRAQDLYAIVDRLQELDTQEEDLKADKANISSEEYNKQLNSIESQKRQQLRRWGNIFEEECAKLEELKSNIEDQLTDFEKEFLAKADQWYTHSDDLRNEVNLALYGFVKPGVKNYTPIHRDLAEVQMDIRTDNTDAPANLENAGFNKERVKARAPIQLTDINFDLLHSSEGIARFYGFTEAQRTFNKIYNAKVLGSGKDRNGQDITVKSKIGNKFGTGNRKWLVTGNQYIENYIRSIAGSNFSREDKFGKIYGHVARANLTLNLRVAVSQLASIPTAAAVLGWDNVLRGMGQGIGYAFSTKQKDQLAEKSIYFWQRYKGDGGMPEYSDASRGAGVVDKLYNRLQNTKVGHALLDWCKIMDCAATSMMYPMAEAYVNQHFGDLEGEAREAKVLEIYEETLRKSQPNYTETERSDLLRDKAPAMRIFTMFKTQSNQNLNLLINANGELRRVIRDKANGNATQAEVQEAKRNFANSFTAVVLGGSLAFAVLRMMSNFILGTLSGYRDDDDELTEESVLKGLGKEVLSSLAGNFMGGSMVFDFVWARVNNENYYGISDNAMGAISDLVDSAFKLQVKPDEGSEEPWGKVISSWSKFALEVCDFAGIPISNAKKIEEAGEMWANDLKNGTFGKFEGNVERTDAQNYNIIIKRFLNEDYAGSQEMYDSMFTSWGEKQDVEAGMKKSIKDKFIDGHITEDDAMSLLLSYVMDDENDAADLITEWHGVIDTGYTYNDIQEAYMEGSATANDLRNYMSKYKFMEKDAIDKKINELDFETENGFAPSKLKDAYVEGEITAQEAAKYYHEVYGKDLDDAKVRVSEWQAYKDTGIEYSEIEDAYYDGKITYNQVVNMLKKYGDKSNSEYSNDEQAVRYADKWRFNKENPKYAGELDVNQVSRWYAEYKGKVKIDKFMMYLDFIGNGYHGAAPSQTEILEWMPSHLTYEEALALWTYKGWSTSNKNMKKLTNAYGK